jgi:hypothetical protein
MDNELRIYNHTDCEVIVAVDEELLTQYLLMPHSISPSGHQPKYLWAAAGDIGGTRVWSVGGYDVHITQTVPEGATVVPSAVVNERLHISGLGANPRKDKTPPVRELSGAWFYDKDEIWVTILGAGITGLSAAHELVTRGFRVQVIERAHGSPADHIEPATRAVMASRPQMPEDPATTVAATDVIVSLTAELKSQLTDESGPIEAKHPSQVDVAVARLARFRRGLDRPDIGGIARTQWSTQPLKRGGAVLLRQEGGPGSTETPRIQATRSVHGDALWFGSRKVGANVNDSYCTFGVGWVKNEPSFDKLSDWLLDDVGQKRSISAVQLVIVAYRDGAEPAYARFEQFLKELTKQKAFVDLIANLEVFPTARIDVDEATMPPDGVGLIIRVHEDLTLIAGEHGFRFFPGFYRHLRDTMNRTPIFDPITRSFTPRTAADNLQAVGYQVIAEPGRPHGAAFAREPYSTIGGMIAQYQTLRRDTGYRSSDLLRFVLRMLRYMTSSSRRRAEQYEKISWWDFLSRRNLGDPKSEPLPYGKRFAEALRHSPKALVAMAGEHADARTQGNISVQLLMDQFGLHDQGDSTLSGPTSTSWLNHWRIYLEQQGVGFFVGEVADIRPYSAKKNERAQVTITWPRGIAPPKYLDGEKHREQGIHEHYFVSALDVVNLARVTKDLRKSAPKKSDNSIVDLNRLVQDNGNDRDLEDIKLIGREVQDRFQTLTGVQLYYKHHVSYVNGHIYFAGSPYGLSAISQVQFWGPFGNGHRSQLKGNLSVDVGAWRKEGNTMSPNDFERGALIAEIQRQIDGGVRPENETVLRRAHYYHIDDFIAYAMDDTKMEMLPRRNHAPFLINVTGEWDLRPRGEPWSPNDTRARRRVPGDRSGYHVEYDNLVVAGTHMRTFTRLGTMEAANESARHAVNAILDHATARDKRKDKDTKRVLDSLSGELEGTGFRIDHFRTEPHPYANVDKNTTRYGDYCDIWNPEAFEFEDLEFLRLVDQHLMEAGERAESRHDDRPEGTPEPYTPHIFDILRVDQLPDLLDDDREATNVLELVGAAMKAFEDSRTDDVPGVLQAIEKARAKIAALFK